MPRHDASSRPARASSCTRDSNAAEKADRSIVPRSIAVLIKRILGVMYSHSCRYATQNAGVGACSRRRVGGRRVGVDVRGRRAVAAARPAGE